MRSTRLVLCFFLALTVSFVDLATADGALGSGASTDGPVDRLPIVDKAVAFHGGELYRRTETELDLCSKSGCFRVASKIDGGLYRHRVSGKARDVMRRVVITNETVEVWEDDQPIAIDTEDAARRYRDWAMARVYFCFLPFRLNDPGVYKEDLGLETWDGKKLHRVKVTFTPGSSTDADDQYTYWFDPDSGRLEQFAYTYTGKPGGIRFRRLHDYRRVGGLLFFDQENLGAEGDEWTVDRLRPESDALREISSITLKNIQVRP